MRRALTPRTYAAPTYLVTYLSFLVFALFVGAIEDDYWIVGGLVIQPPAPQRRSLGDGLMLNDDLMTSGPHSIFMFDSAEDAEVPHGRKLQASPSVDFYIGLKTFIQDYQGFPQYPNRAYYNSSGIARPTITTQCVRRCGLQRPPPGFLTL